MLELRGLGERKVRPEREAKSAKKAESSSDQVNYTLLPPAMADGHSELALQFDKEWSRSNYGGW